jgi:hypothetical protein
MIEGSPNRILTLQERLTAIVGEVAAPEFVPFSWTGSRVPERIAITDTIDDDEIRLLVDIPIGYMRDGMLFTKGMNAIGAYERIVDFEEQSDGSRFNAILIFPANPDAFGAALIKREKNNSIYV